MAADFYDGIAEETARMLQRMQLYVDLALKQGDAVYLEGNNKLVITIRKPKKGQ